MTKNKDIAILIPFRNEEQNLLALLNDLNQLNLKDECELIFINDHSTDYSVKIIESHPLFSHLTLLELSSESFGKKKALEVGVQSSGCDIFWSLDADVRMHKFQLEQVIFWRQLDFDLLVLPVSMSSGKGLVGRIQVIEWQLLQTWTFFSLEAGYPLLANGANLVFKKQLFLGQKDERFNSLSGDDMNILHHAMSNASKICFQNKRTTSVFIKPVDSWLEFFVQRWRWSGKIKKYPKSAIHFFAVLFFFWNLLLFAFEILVFYNWLFLIPISFLALIQVIFVWRNQRKLNGDFSAISHLGFAFFYPVISLFFFITSTFIHVKWKGRPVSLNNVPQAGK
ncbi:MAG: hypothetical protein RL092_1052 [Bacteroidota bacterium]